MKLICLLILCISSTAFAKNNSNTLDKLSKQQFFQLKNRWKSNQFIHIERGTPQASSIQSAWHSAQWTFEHVQGGFVRIKNRWKGTYLHNQNGRLEAGNIQKGWWSAQWKFERVGNFFRIKNRWKNTYLHIERGSLQLSSIDMGWHSAQWSTPSVSTAPANTYKPPTQSQTKLQTVSFPSNFNGYWYQGSTPVYYVNSSKSIRVSNITHYVQNSYYSNGTYHILTETGGRYVMFFVRLSSNQAQISKSSVYANRDAARRASAGNFTSYARSAPQAYSQPNNTNAWPTVYFPSQLNGAWKLSNGAQSLTIRNSSKIKYQGYEFTVVKTMLNSGIHKIIARYGNSYYYAFYFKVLTTTQAQFWRSGSFQSASSAEHASMGSLSTIYKSTQAPASSWRQMSFPSTLNGNWYNTNGQWMYEVKNSNTIRTGNVPYSVRGTYLKGNTYKVIAQSNSTRKYHAFHFILDSQTKMRMWRSGAYTNEAYAKNANTGQLLSHTKKASKSKTSAVTKTAKAVGQGVYDAGRATGNAAKSGAKAVNKYFTGGKKKAGSNYITLWNTAGYVAKFTVKYRINGKEKKWGTGDMALGAKKNFKIPSNATSIQVNGRAKKLFGGYKSIFKWKSQGNTNKCYKVYGTIISPKYNHNCK